MYSLLCTRAAELDWPDAKTRWPKSQLELQSSWGVEGLRARDPSLPCSTARIGTIWRMRAAGALSGGAQGPCWCPSLCAGDPSWRGESHPYTWGWQWLHHQGLFVCAHWSSHVHLHGSVWQLWEAAYGGVLDASPRWEIAGGDGWALPGMSSRSAHPQYSPPAVASVLCRGSQEPALPLTHQSQVFASKSWHQPREVTCLAWPALTTREFSQGQLSFSP